jgi:hypothetical protein
MGDMPNNVENERQSILSRRFTRRGFLKGVAATAGLSALAVAGIECGPDGKPISKPTATPTLPLKDYAPGIAKDAVKTSTAGPSATSEVEPTVDHDKLPYEIGWSQEYKGFTLAIQKEAMQPRKVPDPRNGAGAGTLDEPGIHEITLNTADFPDAEERVNQAKIYAMYRGWQRADSSRANVTLDEYNQKLQNGEDMTFKIKGFQGDSYITDLENPVIIDPTKDITIVAVANGGTQIHPFDGYDYGFRRAEGKLYFEMYDYRTFGLDGYMAEGQGHPLSYDFAGDMTWELSFLSETSVQEKGTYDFSQVNATIESQTFNDIQNTLIPSKNPEWNSVIRVK